MPHAVLPLYQLGSIGHALTSKRKFNFFLLPFLRKKNNEKTFSLDENLVEQKIIVVASYQARQPFNMINEADVQEYSHSGAIEFWTIPKITLVRESRVTESDSAVTTPFVEGHGDDTQHLSSIN